MPEKSVKIAEVVVEKPPPFATNRSKTEMLRPPGVPEAARNSSNQSGSSAEGSGSRKSMGHKLKLFTFGGRKGRGAVWGSNIDETVFDGQLQEAIAHLTNLGGRLGELELEGEQRPSPT